MDCREFESKVNSAMSAAAGGSVLACVSGGADSMAMLVALHAIGVPLHVIHCNFHLRGEESNRDQRFVEDECHRMQLPLIVEDIDIKAYRRGHKVSIETACRDTRYRLFRRHAARLGMARIAVAHNSDDQAETLLLNLLRGAGIRGLSAMSPDTGKIIRPLLSISRADILEYLTAKGVSFIVDSTNLEDDYRRNFLRLRVLPLLAERWPAASRTIARAAANLRQDLDALSILEREWLPDAFRLPYSTLSDFPQPLWLMHRFCTHAEAPESMAAEMLESFHSYDFQKGKRWYTRKGMIVAERDAFAFYPEEAVKYIENERPPFRIGRVAVDDDMMLEIKESPLTEFWGDIEEEDVILRHPQQGDRICPLGMKGSMLVSKVMKDAGYTDIEKRRQWLLQHRVSGEILWLPGLKRSRHHLASPPSALQIFPTED